MTTHVPEHNARSSSHMLAPTIMVGCQRTKASIPSVGWRSIPNSAKHKSIYEGRRTILFGVVPRKI